MVQLQRAGVELRAGFKVEWLVASPAAEGTPALLDALEAAGRPWLQCHPVYGASSSCRWRRARSWRPPTSWCTPGC
ncbi:hypothetical protein [Cyanobium gracile]|uniref:Uncharacterized protein n=1 Tax=Cyanobium gracile (strain ATCC 27147 / PCC 6307) TaxID=292564 RepID=K9PAG5_CYAGP|nr:hypothetical protein [Cyanobium gracile]AFY29584.1 hypothetical protein Cyagr_2478 [Cyanobium gracile PCC 6307]